MSKENKEENSFKGKAKRVFALIAAVLLALMYVMTLIFAITDNPDTMSMFKASLILTVILPIFLYAYQLVYRVIRDSGKKTVIPENKENQGKGME